MTAGVTWGELARVRPDLADAGRGLLYQFGVGLAFLGTVRSDGGPRLHPVCPLLADEDLFAFVVPSAKREDLHRDGRYALHSFPCPDNEDAFYVTGQAFPVTDVARRARLGEQFAAERAELSVPPPGETEELFAFFVSRCLLTRTTGHGDPTPRHEVWTPGGGPV
ncbi:MAG TPA: hypothetical protein VK277_07495 [Acidimicrobiales bacterium]|nr:hypothetical protein [Acidimicrobiales bacterium]